MQDRLTLRATNWSFLLYLRRFQNINLWQTFQTLFARKEGLTFPPLLFLYMKINHFNVVFHIIGEKWENVCALWSGFSGWTVFYGFRFFSGPGFWSVSAFQTMLSYYLFKHLLWSLFVIITAFAQRLTSLAKSPIVDI